MLTCPYCKIRLPRTAARCLECGATVPRDHARLTDADHRRLTALVRALPERDATARTLAAKLDQAEVVPMDAIEPDIVTLEARIAYRLGNVERVHRRTLVLPERYIPNGQWLSVLSPLGLALLGMRAGLEVPYADYAGTPCPLALLAVEWQPEAHALRGRPPSERSPLPRQMRPTCDLNRKFRS